MEYREYREKYFKYKQKYLTLKNNLSGGKFASDEDEQHVRLLLKLDKINQTQFDEFNKSSSRYTIADILGLGVIKDASADENFTEEMRSKLLNGDIKKINVYGDGNCFFYCCELYLYGTQYQTINGEILNAEQISDLGFDFDRTLIVTQIRYNTVNYILDNCNDYINAILDDEYSEDFKHEEHEMYSKINECEDKQYSDTFNELVDYKIRGKIESTDSRIPNFKKRLFLWTLNYVWANDMVISAFIKLYKINIMIFESKHITYIKGNEAINIYSFFVKKTTDHYDFLFIHKENKETIIPYILIGGFYNHNILDINQLLRISKSPL